MEKIIYIQKVLDYFDDLIFTLFQKEYFSYYENAESYLIKIDSFIQNDIHTFPHKKTPKQLKHLGSNYIFYKSNSRTTWYIFFEKFNNNYLITGVLNNHCEEAKFI